jgi:hypothetical protein
VLFVTESAASTAALSERYDQLAIAEPPPGEAPLVEALQVLPCNHRSVVAAHLLTARRIVIPTGGARAGALAAAFAVRAAAAEAAGPTPEPRDPVSQPAPATADKLAVGAG